MGFAKKSTDVPPEKVRIHVAQGIPRSWGPEDLETFLTAQHWTELSNFVRKRNSWTFRGKAPSESRTFVSWHYDIGDAESVTWTITIQVAVRTPQTPQTSFSLKGPRQGVTLRDYWPEAQISDPEVLPQAKQESGPPAVRSAQPGPQPHVTAASTAATGHIESSQNRDRSRSPKGGDEVAPTALDGVSQTQNETTDAVNDQQAPTKKLRLTEPGDPAEAVENFGWRRWDQGGNGDCFFRSASVFIDGKLSTQPQATDSQKKASWIRAQTCQHIKKHSKRFGELFECKQQFDDWVKKAANQTSWADGRTIQAATEKLGCPVVIWNKEGNTYTRFVVAPRFSRGFACGSDNCTPICVLLESKHYVALVPPPKSSVPKNWLRETPDVIIDLSGGGRRALLSSSTQSVEAAGNSSVPFPSTPSVRSLAGSVASVACSGEKQRCAASLPSPTSVSELGAPDVLLGTPSAHSLVSGRRSSASMSCRGSVVDGCRESVATLNCGGNGGCHFRTFAHSLADSLVREASKLRFLAVGHVMKHRDDFEPHWVHDPNEPAFMRAYQNPPDSFSDYLMLASLQGFYADHLLIQALATRIGVPIVVFAWNSKTWQRTVFAPGFRNGIATTTGKNLKPVVLTLQDNHFKVVRSIRSDDPVPEAWLRETARCEKEFLRGGGPKSVLSLPQSTPAKASGGKRRAPRSLSLPSATPNKRSVASTRSSGRSLALPAATLPKPEVAPSRVTSRSALSLPASRTPRASSHKRQAFSEVQPPLSKRFRPSSVSVRSGLSQCSSAHARSADPAHEGPQPSEIALAPEVLSRTRDGQIFVWWTCELCGYKVFHHKDLSHARAYVSKKNHLLAVHKQAASEVYEQTQDSLPARHVVQKTTAAIRAKCFSDIIQEEGWRDLHKVVFVQKPLPQRSVWKCKTCHKVFQWGHVPHQSCAAVCNPKLRAKLSSKQRTSRWEAWWHKAQKKFEQQNEERVTQVKTIQWLQEQYRLHESQPVVVPAPFHGLTLVPAPPPPTAIWWTCEFCNFHITYGDKHPCARRLYHLERTHQHKTYLSRTGNKNPTRALALNTVVTKRWRQQLEEFKKVRWSGAHDINPEPATVKVSHNKNGKTYRKSLFRCQACQHLLPADGVATSICTATDRKAPSLQVRNRLWKKCRNLASEKVTKWAGPEKPAKPELRKRNT